MGLLLTTLVVFIIIGVVVSMLDHEWGWTLALTIWGVVIGAIMFLIPFLFSWDSAVDQHKRLATVEQYVTRIHVYEKLAKGNFETAEITDMKYNNYQEQIGTMLTSLGTLIVSYNKVQVGKKIYNNNWFFWGMIHYDESLPAELKLEDYIQ